MKVLSFATQKGGSGKSTLLACCSVAAIEEGKKVYILEMDKQATISQWGDMRHSPEPDMDTISSENLELGLKALKKLKYDYVFIDTPGADNPGVANAIKFSDFIVMPCRPTPADIKGCLPTVETVKRLNGKFGFVINQCASNPKNSRSLEAIKALSSIGLLADVLIVSRVDYQDAIGIGYGITEFKPGSKGATEIKELWKWIRKQVDDRPAKEKVNRRVNRAHA